jgi:hypothetical protein
VQLWRRKLQSDDDDGQEWKCGICDQSFHIWKKRLKHIGKHWEAGLSMKNWKTGVSATGNSLDFGNEDKDGLKEANLPNQKGSTVHNIWSALKRVLPHT